MPSELEIHPASSGERVAAHQNVFDIWSKGLPLDEHVQHRLKSPSHSRATWFVGTLNGRVVVSLGAYPIRFRARGQELAGIAIGSVYTLGPFRGHGYAPQLLAWVETYAHGRQTALSVLYSDIGSDYYARLGYVPCPSLEGWSDPRTAVPKSTNGRLVAISPGEHLSTLQSLYAGYHGGFPLSVVRDAEYWEMILKKNAADRHFALEGSGGAWQGYVRIGWRADSSSWRITDYALADRSEALADELYAALGELARTEGVKKLGGWIPDSASAKKLFVLAPRRTEITMIKPLTYGGPLDGEMIACTSHFCEIDHV